MGGRKGDQDDRKWSDVFVDNVSELDGRGTTEDAKAPRKPTNSSPTIEFGVHLTWLSLVATKLSRCILASTVINPFQAKRKIMF